MTTTPWAKSVRRCATVSVNLTRPPTVGVVSLTLMLSERSVRGCTGDRDAVVVVLGGAVIHRVGVRVRVLREQHLDVVDPAAVVVSHPRRQMQGGAGDRSQVDHRPVPRRRPHRQCATRTRGRSEPLLDHGGRRARAGVRQRQREGDVRGPELAPSRRRRWSARGRRWADPVTVTLRIVVLELPMWLFGNESGSRWLEKLTSAIDDDGSRVAGPQDDVVDGAGRGGRPVTDRSHPDRGAGRTAIAVIRHVGQTGRQPDLDTLTLLTSCGPPFVSVTVNVKSSPTNGVGSSTDMASERSADWRVGGERDAGVVVFRRARVVRGRVRVGLIGGPDLGVRDLGRQ